MAKESILSLPPISSFKFVMLFMKSVKMKVITDFFRYVANDTHFAKLQDVLSKLDSRQDFCRLAKSVSRVLDTLHHLIVCPGYREAFPLYMHLVLQWSIA